MNQHLNAGGANAVHFGGRLVSVPYTGDPFMYCADEKSI
jgi:hypothetical protein